MSLIQNSACRCTSKTRSTHCASYSIMRDQDCPQSRAIKKKSLAKFCIDRTRYNSRDGIDNNPSVRKQTFISHPARRINFIHHGRFRSEATFDRPDRGRIRSGRRKGAAMSAGAEQTSVPRASPRLRDPLRAHPRHERRREGKRQEERNEGGENADVALDRRKERERRRARSSGKLQRYRSISEK
ncbi:hypothetical protein PUN28_018110 [Cardiocondyla obscurior]|uniref:Uncharacterized protein n=1 Tax=Cardiocondyla obscurior TaxID=286306 RepID=A0AAW2ELQ1_9HYME